MNLWILFSFSVSLRSCANFASFLGIRQIVSLSFNVKLVQEWKFGDRNFFLLRIEYSFEFEFFCIDVISRKLSRIPGKERREGKYGGGQH